MIEDEDGVSNRRREGGAAIIEKKEDYKIKGKVEVYSFNN